MKSRIVLILIIGLALLIGLSGCLDWLDPIIPNPLPKEPNCFAHFIVSCVSNGSVVSDKIACVTDDDCSPEKMSQTCAAGTPGLAVCPGTQYYCYNNFCKGCGCVE